MWSRTRLPLAWLFLVLVFAGAAISAPTFINYKANLNDSNGNPVPDATYSITFRIYDVETGGSPKWTETHAVVTKNGTFKVKLGSATSFPDTLFGDSLMYLGMAVSPDPEMTPRSPIGTVPFSLRAAKADGVKNKSIGKEHIKDKQVDKEHIKDKAIGKEHVNDKAIERTHIKDKAIGKDQIDSLAIDDTRMKNSSLTLKKIANDGALPGHVIKWTGTRWVASPDSANNAVSDWTLVGGDVLETPGEYGIARAGSQRFGSHDSTHVNLGVAGRTGSQSADNRYATVSGGQGNWAQGEGAAVGGGQMNIAQDNHTTVGGGFSNGAALENATVAGGYGNVAGGAFTFIGGGQSGNIGGNATYSSIVGGYQNIVDFSAAGAIGGGIQNSITSAHAGTIGGGENNEVASTHATVGGGHSNTAAGDHATIGGGSSNIASATGATVPGGVANAAYGFQSLAAGAYAVANAAGAVVIQASDNDQQLDTSNDNQMVLGAQGNFYLTNQSESAPLGANRFLNTSTGAYLTVGGTWTNSCDVAGKENFAPVDGEDVLEKIGEMEITRWNYRVENPDVQHIGPTAQEFHRLFGLGDSDKSIATTDLGGVSLVAIRALYEKVRAMESASAETAALRAEVQRLSALVEKLAAKEAGR